MQETNAPKVRNFKLTRMSGRGDELVAEWTETTSLEQLAAIESEFNRLQKEGYFAADLGSNEIIKKFNPASDILMLPRMQGGSAD